MEAVQNTNFSRFAFVIIAGFIFGVVVPGIMEARRKQFDVDDDFEQRVKEMHEEHEREWKEFEDSWKTP